MNVLFLDFDGVINTPMWDTEGRCGFNYPESGKVNNWQACQWVNLFCIRFDYKIVVSSTWRKDGLEECRQILYNSGIDERISVIDITPVIDGAERGTEIAEWLSSHSDVTSFIIFDDDADMGDLLPRLIQCRSDAGFLRKDFTKARELHISDNYTRGE